MKILLFTFTDADILKEVTKRTSYLGKSRGTEQQMHLLDRLSLTEGENFLFQEFLEDSITEVYDWLKAFGRKVPLSIWHRDSNATIVSAGAQQITELERGTIVLKTVSGVNTFYITYNACNLSDYESNSYDVGSTDPRGSIRFWFGMTDHFDYNMIDSIDRHIRTSLVDYIIFRWLQYVFPDESKRFFDEFEDNAQKAKNGLDSEDHVIVRPYTML